VRHELTLCMYVRQRYILSQFRSGTDYKKKTTVVERMSGYNIHYFIHRFTTIRIKHFLLFSVKASSSNAKVGKLLGGIACGRDTSHGSGETKTFVSPEPWLVSRPQAIHPNNCPTFTLEEEAFTENKRKCFILIV